MNGFERLSDDLSCVSFLYRSKEAVSRGCEVKTMRRKIFSAGVVALLLLSLVGCGVGDSGDAVDKVAKGLLPGRLWKETPPWNTLNGVVKVVHSGFGFALTDNDEFHVLKIHIERWRHLQPQYIRGLLKANKSIEEIRAELSEKEAATLYRGDLRLGEKDYRLVNISVAEDDDYRSLVADIEGPLGDPESGVIVGNISVTARDYECVRIGNGTLTMNKGDSQGEYQVLLNICSPFPWTMEDV